MTAEEIKQLREKLGLSQPAFAQKLGVSLNTVNQWERSKTKPSILANNQLQRLLREFNRHCDIPLGAQWRSEDGKDYIFLETGWKRLYNAYR